MNKTNEKQSGQLVLKDRWPQCWNYIQDKNTQSTQQQLNEPGKTKKSNSEETKQKCRLKTASNEITGGGGGGGGGASTSLRSTNPVVLVIG